VSWRAFAYSLVSLGISLLFDRVGKARHHMIYAFENCQVDVLRRELHRGNDLVPVEPGVFDLLHYLICNRHRVVSKEDLIAAVWAGRTVSDSTLSGRINAARSAIGDRAISSG
jgi:DNA-binding winged helix-turn-helix (wHTH) protein